MNEREAQLDLVCLVADNNQKETMLGLLGRPESLGIRALRFTVLVHPEHDPGCFRRAPDFLRSYSRSASRALVLLDHEGCGKEDVERSELEADLERRLRESGWAERAGAVVIDPELESWVWSDSPKVGRALGWVDRAQNLRQWLEAERILAPGESKPVRPKEAVERVLFEVRLPRSSSLYRELADGVTFRRCEDPAFGKLRGLLSRWFPAGP